MKIIILFSTKMKVDESIFDKNKNFYYVRSRSMRKCKGNVWNSNGLSREIFKNVEIIFVVAQSKSPHLFEVSCARLQINK